MAADFDVAVEFQADFVDDPTAQFSKYLTKRASPNGYSGHTDTKLDDLYQLDPCEAASRRTGNGGDDRAANVIRRHHNDAAALLFAHVARCRPARRRCI
jgi:hypothetical protein